MAFRNQAHPNIPVHGDTEAISRRLTFTLAQSEDKISTRSGDGGRFAKALCQGEFALPRAIFHTITIERVASSTMSKYMVLAPLPDRIESDWIVRSCQVRRRTGPRAESQQTLWYKFRAANGAPNASDCDAYLRALVLDAMREQRTLVIEGSVSRKLLANLTEFQSAWNKWLPDTYHLVPMEPHEARPTVKCDSLGNAICAFSGGVDATFSVWMHSQKRNGWRTRDISLCALVHGFDIPLNNQAMFDHVLLRSSQTLQELNIPITPVVTNYREITTTKWEHAFSAALVAALDTFKANGTACLIGSGQPYNSVVVPWGSSPLTDHLLSSGDFDVILDGASHNRSEKIREIGDWAQGMRNLRVCWQGEQKDANCGKCEKCLRTMANFLACGKPIPPCFPEQATLTQNLKSITLRTDVLRSEWRGIVNAASAHGVSGAWIHSVRQMLKRRRASEYVFPVGSRGRTLGNRMAIRLKALGKTNWFRVSKRAG
jgi:hypothetical protein